MLRVSKDPKDKSYSPTADKRRVWCKDVEVINWSMADEFRRVVVTLDGRVLNGPVRIERLPEDSPPPPEPVIEPSVNSMAGLFVHTPDPTPPPVAAPTTAPYVVAQQEVPVARVTFEQPELRSEDDGESSE